jgi:hypothetical protein
MYGLVPATSMAPVTPTGRPPAAALADPAIPNSNVSAAAADIQYRENLYLILLALALLLS